MFVLPSTGFELTPLIHLDIYIYIYKLVYQKKKHDLYYRMYMQKKMKTIIWERYLMII